MSLSCCAAASLPHHNLSASGRRLQYMALELKQIGSVVSENVIYGEQEVQSNEYIYFKANPRTIIMCH
jgi:hypothetical protein